MKVLIAGYGSAGQYLTDFLLKDHRIASVHEIHIMSRKSTEEVTPRLDLSRVSAGISERFIPLIYHQCDFNNIESMAHILNKVKPNVVVYTGRYAAGFKYGSFSYPNNIGYGVWMPMSFPYIYNLMKAVKMSGRSTRVINTSFPDGVNYLLGQIDLAPYCGAGNINHLIPRIRNAVAKKLDEPVKNIDVSLACAHYVNTYVSKEGTERKGASLLNVRTHWSGDVIYDKSLKEQDPEKIELYKLCKDQSIGGQVRNQMIATDCAELVRILTTYLGNDRVTETIHIPGFQGRPGGQKYYVKGWDIQPDLSIWSQDEIDKVNLEGLRNDGVIIDHGIYFTEEVRTKMKDIFNLEYPKKLNIDEIQPFADEIYSKLKEVSYK